MLLPLSQSEHYKDDLRYSQTAPLDFQRGRWGSVCLMLHRGGGAAIRVAPTSQHCPRIPQQLWAGSSSPCSRPCSPSCCPTPPSCPPCCACCWTPLRMPSCPSCRSSSSLPRRRQRSSCRCCRPRGHASHPGWPQCRYGSPLGSPCSGSYHLLMTFGRTTHE